MATPTVDDLDALLASLYQLKPPGASKTKIATITTLCVNNIQAESPIAQSLYRSLKKAPVTHKLGVLYVIDSVVRQWIEKAKAAGQDLNLERKGEAGTYSAAVRRMTELMPPLFDDIMRGMPAEQKPKLENMVTIWERGSTFPAKMLADFKAKLSGQPNQPTPANGVSANMQQLSIKPGEKFAAPIPTRTVNTPVGFPPRQLYDYGFLPGRAAPPTHANGTSGSSQQSTPMQANFSAQQSVQQPQHTQAAPSADVNSILAALSKAAPPAASTPTFPSASQPAAAPPALPAGIPPQLAALFGQQMPAQSTPTQQPQQLPYGYSTPSAPPMPAAYPQPPPPFPGYPPQPPPSIPQAYSVAPPPPQQSDPLSQLRGLLPENILNDRQKLIPALQLLQDLQKDGIPPDKWGPVLKAFEEQYQPQPTAPTPGPAYGGQGDYGRSRGRSRSPDRGRGGRGSPVYGSYDAGARGPAEENRDPRGGQQRGRYRQRSPVRDSPSAVAMNGRPMQPKVIEYDPSLPPNNIKVLSRTLFVGGANGTQQEIQDLFERFGRVQTCIANRDKRHAFVKMTSRQFALNAKAGMEDLQNRNDREVMNIARQTKWGVGFGPRECCDYQRGESIIPIHKLTEADLKWLLTAEYGGTGGKQLEGGMVLEEPDIEIGAGVSSKAMSKRVGPDNAPPAKRHREDRGRHGKHKGGHGGGGGGGGGGDQGYGGYSGVSGGPPPMPMDPYPYPRPEPVAVATPPAVPGFGFNLGLPTNGGNTYR
ncbi:hypothetical protein M409DRAFT_28253 [Zasmidium cellare ATCC 36951]|uniref:CID domain-containing protein n=1 Tax=Zasmidium cellare ATCC 36951 TaxID=1080233 RepID=A0A6A6C2P9_ZASCE|nr:uncharacterized protein M409DRAFT_28253 [Zasmidium cellare ATCC 36951]KAF2161213.1 hypothetical protein M409DRAFT_28253 [Zasmidium cellare ATCC 36951]